MTRRRTFAVGALAGLVLWPALAFAILVATSIGAHKRDETRARVEAERRDWEAFEKAHPELLGGGQ